MILQIANRCLVKYLSSIPRSLEVDVEVEDAALKRASESSLVAVFPFLVHDLERDILVRWARGDFEQTRFGIWRTVGLDFVRRRLGGVDEVRVEDVELVPLHNLWRRI